MSWEPTFWSERERRTGTRRDRSRRSVLGGGAGRTHPHDRQVERTAGAAALERPATAVLHLIGPIALVPRQCDQAAESIDRANAMLAGLTAAVPHDRQLWGYPGPGAPAHLGHPPAPSAPLSRHHSPGGQPPRPDRGAASCSRPPGSAGARRRPRKGSARAGTRAGSIRSPRRYCFTCSAGPPPTRSPSWQRCAPIALSATTLPPSALIWRI